MVPNPLYEGEQGDFTKTVCVDPKERLEILGIQHPTWGMDCISGTPDDDDNDIGQDECAWGFTWDESICECVYSLDLPMLQRA